jgi:hypothetical protein
VGNDKEALARWKDAPPSSELFQQFAENRPAVDGRHSSPWAYSYLRDVLTRLPDMTNWQVPEVTPAAWAKARAQAIPLKAAS